MNSCFCCSKHEEVLGWCIILIYFINLLSLQSGSRFLSELRQRSEPVKYEILPRGLKWLHLRYLFSNRVPSSFRTPAKDWHSRTDLLWLVSVLHCQMVTDWTWGSREETEHGVQDPNGRITAVISDLLARRSLLIIVKGLISEAQRDLSCRLFLSYHLYPLAQCPPLVARHHLSYLWPVRSVIHLHSVTTSVVWFPPTPFFAHFF